MRLSLRTICFSILLLAAGFHYLPMIRGMLLLYTSPAEDMSHAYLVPFVSLFVLWYERKRLAAAAGAPDGRGLAWSLLFLVFAWFGSRGGQARMELLSMIGLAWSVPFALWGAGVERLLRFPAAFMLFTIPLSSYIVFVTVPLRLFCTKFTEVLLNGFGLDIQQSGTALACNMPGHRFSVDVADACSGIRSLFAMMALMAAYAYFSLKNRRQFWMLFLCSIPVAVIGNIMRLIIICLVARFVGQTYAVEQPYHSWYGFVTYLVGVLLMLWLAKLMPALEAKLFKKPAAPPTPATVPTTGTLTNLQRGIVILEILLCLGVFESGFCFGPAVYDEHFFLKAALPASLPGFTGDNLWFCQNDQCALSFDEKSLRAKQAGPTFTCPACGAKLDAVSIGEKENLPADTTLLKRNYSSAEGYSYSVNYVLSGRWRGSIHRAELCLPSQGYVIMKTEKKPLNIPGGHPREVKVITATASGSGHEFALAYWFVSREHECCEHERRIVIDIWDRSIHNRINRWAMIAINSSSPLDTPESLDAFENFVHLLYSALRP